MRSISERQVDLVYRQLARTAGFRGFRPGFLLQVAAASAIATLVLSLIASGGTVMTIAVLWVLVAAAIAMWVTGGVIVPALRDRSSVVRETARGVVGQMLPPVAVGAVVTVTIILRFHGAMSTLPALWLVLFGLGVAAISPFVMARLEYASLVYFVAGAAAFALRSTSPIVFSLIVGIPFVCGHAVTALLLAASPSTEDTRSGAVDHTDSEEKR